MSERERESKRERERERVRERERERKRFSLTTIHSHFYSLISGSECTHSLQNINLLTLLHTLDSLTHSPIHTLSCHTRTLQVMFLETNLHQIRPTMLLYNKHVPIHMETQSWMTTANWQIIIMMRLMILMTEKVGT